MFIQSVTQGGGSVSDTTTLRGTPPGRVVLLCRFAGSVNLRHPAVQRKGAELPVPEEKH